MITELEGFTRMSEYCQNLLRAKNGDYGASWRRMRKYGISDIIANKIDRVRSLEDKELRGEKPEVSEGIESDIHDIVNYCVFYLIKLWEQEERPS